MDDWDNGDWFLAGYIAADVTHGRNMPRTFMGCLIYVALAICGVAYWWMS